MEFYMWFDELCFTPIMNNSGGRAVKYQATGWEEEEPITVWMNAYHECELVCQNREERKRERQKEKKTKAFKTIKS